MLPIFETGKHILDFSAQWCPPCNRIAPYFKILGDENMNIKFIKFDVEIDREIALEFNIQAMPTFISMHDGNIIERFEGASKDRLREMVDKLNSL
jgi:thioredoxin 1